MSSDCVCGLIQGAAKCSFTMADGGSDDEVIHLASFNVHRSQGETSHPHRHACRHNCLSPGYMIIVFMHLSICLLPLVQVRVMERARAFRICGKIHPGTVTSLLQS